MTPVLALPGRPGVFLLWFAAIAALLLLGWSWLAEPYAQVLVRLVNVGSQSAGLPDSLRLTASGTHGAIGSAIVATIALFAATPARDLLWKFGWSALSASLLFAVHAALLTTQVRLAYAGFEAARTGPRGFLSGVALIPVDAATGDVAGAWYWLFPLLTALLWFAAMQRPVRN